MKIVIIGDTHFGARNDNQIFIDYFISFFEKTLFPYMQENGIENVIHLGDFMDRRKYINFHTLSQVRSRVLDKLETMKIHMHCILGNHDTYFRNTNNINSIRELFGNKYKNISIHEKPSTIHIGGLDFDMIPWINSENRQQTLDFIHDSHSLIACGHFELNGYQIMRGVDFHGEMNDTSLKNYETVFSGHFHAKQSKGNIHYLGTQYQITFSDLFETKGFHVFDTETRTFEFIKNPHNMFFGMTYSDKSKDEVKHIQDFLESNLDGFKDSYVKVFVKSKSNPYLFDRYMDTLTDAGAHHIIIVEENDMSLYNIDCNEDDDKKLAQDTISLINNEIDLLENDGPDKEKLKHHMHQLFMEAISQ